MLPVPATAVTVPPHVLASPFGVATTRPAGSVSVKPTPVSAVPAFGLVSVNVSVVVPFTGMLSVPNALAIVGGATTVRLAEAVPPVPPSVEVTALVVLFLAPAVVPVTLTVSVHEPPAGRPPLASPTLPAPATAVTVPPHVLANPFGVATTSPAGSVSVKPTPPSVIPGFGLVSVNVSVVVPFTTMLATPKALAIVGGAAVGGVTTTRNAVAVPPVPPSVEVTALVVLPLRPRRQAGDVDRDRAGAAGGQASVDQPDAAGAGDRGDRAATRARQPVRGGHHDPGRQRVGEAHAGQRGPRVRVGQRERQRRGPVHQDGQPPERLGDRRRRDHREAGRGGPARRRPRSR